MALQAAGRRQHNQNTWISRCALRKFLIRLDRSVESQNKHVAAHGHAVALEGRACAGACVGQDCALVCQNHLLSGFWCKTVCKNDRYITVQFIYAYTT